MIRKSDLNKRWVHSHEEDDEKGAVYRPSGYKFPRARGRVAFELKEDGTCEYFAIGRGDKSESTACTWTFETGTRSLIRLRMDSGETLILPIVSVDADRLVIAPEG